MAWSQAAGAQHAGERSREPGGAVRTTGHPVRMSTLQLAQRAVTAFTMPAPSHSTHSTIASKKLKTNTRPPPFL